MIRLDSKGTVKISDFGLSEEIYTSGYFRQNKKDAVRLPFKWMAPESLTDALFTSQSDVVNKIMYAQIIKKAKDVYNNIYDAFCIAIKRISRKTVVFGINHMSGVRKFS